MIGQVMSFIFGDGRNAVAEVAEVFRENADKGAQRSVDMQGATLKQFAAEFAHPRKGLFDRFIDGINRLPRPMLALGTIGLFVSAMFDPAWFSSRMAGIALVPEPLWWLMGAIVSFYFGARHQAKGQEFQRSVVQTVAMREALKVPEEKIEAPIDNPALADWQAQR
jgi:hypothetical protein